MMTVRIWLTNPQSSRDAFSYHPKSLWREMDAIVCQANWCWLIGKRIKQVDHDGLALTSDPVNCLSVCFYCRIKFAKIWSVRRQRFLEWHWRDQDQLTRSRGKRIEESIVEGRKLCQSLYSIKGFHLPKLCDHHRRAYRLQLI